MYQYVKTYTENGAGYIILNEYNLHRFQCKF